jgi:PadR family transcriptional regulator PadR
VSFPASNLWHLKLTAVLHVRKIASVTTPRMLTLSAKERIILELLVRDRELYGLELVSGSNRRLKRGTVYVTLGRMEEKGYVASRLEAPPPTAGGLPRRLYQPTALGRRVLAVWSGASRQLLPAFA